MRKKVSMIASIIVLGWHMMFMSFVTPLQVEAAIAGFTNNFFTNVSLETESGATIDVGQAIDQKNQVIVKTAWSIDALTGEEGKSYTLVLPKQLKVDANVNGSLKSADGSDFATYKVSTDGKLTIHTTKEITTELTGTGDIKFPAKWDESLLKDVTNTSLEFLANGDAVTIPVQFIKAEVEEKDTDVSEEETETGNKPEDEKADADSKTEEAAEDKATSEENATKEESSEPESKEKASEKKNEATPKARAFNLAKASGVTITENLVTDFTLSKINKDGQKEVLQPGTPIIVDPNEEFKVILDYVFELPNNHSYTEGAQYTLEIPSTFKIQPNPEPQSLTVNGVEFATFIVNQTNGIEITFTDKIEGNSNVRGSFELSSDLKAHGDQQANETVKVPISGKQDLEYEILFKPTGDTLDKRIIEGNNGYNTKEVKWQVDLNKQLDNLQAATLEDNLPAGLVLKPGSIKVYKLKMKANGTVQEPVEDTSFSFSNFPLDFGNIQDAYRVEYVTNVTDEEKTYTNDAILKDGGTKISGTDATLSVKRGEPIKKSAKYSDPSKQEVTWTIEYNYNEKAVDGNNARISDSFTTDSPEQIFIDKDGNEVTNLKDAFTVYEVDIDPNTGKVTGAPTLFDQYTVTGDHSGFELKFDNSITKAYKIEYKTKAKDRITTTTPVKTVKNNVVNDFNDSDTASAPLEQQVLTKTRGGVNYSDKTVEWTIQANKDKYETDDVLFTDELPEGFILDETSLVVNIGGKKTEENKYDFTYDQQSRVFTIKLKDEVTEQVTITYTTKIDFDLTTKRDDFTNKVDMNWVYPDEPAVKHTQEAADTFRPDRYTGANGYKTSKYKFTEKKIDWEIGVNYNKQKLTDATVTDYILTKDTQDFDHNDVKVSKMKINGANQAEAGEPLETDKYRVEPATDADGNKGFIVHFIGDITEPYVIQYHTDLKGKVVGTEYKNEAILDSSNQGPVTYTSTVKPYHGNEIVDKSGKQNNENPRRINWRVKLNYSKSYIDDFKLEDTPSNNQAILPDSIKVYKTTESTNDYCSSGCINKDGNNALELNKDYRFTITEVKDDDGNVFETLKLEFLNPIEEAYVLEYDTYILFAESGDATKYSNTLSANGTTLENMPVKDGKDATVSLNQILGQIQGNVGDLTVTKVDEDGQPLANAEFSLYDGNQQIRSYVTDSEGQVTFRNLLYDKDYTLKETKAPEGYVIGTAEQTVKINDKVTNLSITNKKNIRAVQFTKVDPYDGKPLEGVVFELQKKDVDGFYQFVSEHVTDADGNIFLEELEAADYQFVEKTPLEGYIKDETEYPFTITNEQTEVIDLGQVENEMQLGSLSLTKVDEDGQPLEGVVFKLVTEGDVVVPGHEKLTTDENGKIEVNNLRPGTYYFVETDTLEGYELDSTPHEAIVSKNQTQTNDLGEITNKLIRGSVILLKKNTNGDVLEGVEFQLLDANGKVVPNGSELITNENGQIIVDDLKPGVYQFIETKALPGYELDDQPITFEIGQNQKLPESITITVEAVNTSSPVDVELTKVDDYGDPVADAEFELNGKTYKTDENGKLTVTGLLPGTYEFTEISVPDCYILNPDKVSFTIDYGQTETEKVNVVNEVKPVKVDLILTEQGKDDVLLEGGEFELRDENGEVFKDENGKVIIFTTDENGKVDLPDLKPGKYTLTQIKTKEGYNFEKNPETTFEVEKCEDKTVRVPNEPTPGDVVLTKVDDYGDPVAGAEFELNGKTYKTDKNGKFTVKGLVPGKYEFVEKSVADCYILNNEPVPFEIKLGQKQATQVNVVNEVKPVKVDLILTEQGKDDVLLEGGEFELRDENGEVFKDGNGEVIIFTTDENGKVDLPDLKPGKYTLTQIKTKEGYNFEKNPETTFTVEKCEDQTVRVPNEPTPGDVELTKVDDYGDPVAGAEFELNGKTYKTDKNGKFTVKGLAPGKYEFVEKTVADCYILNNEPVPFEIKLGQTEATQVNVVNEVKPVKVNVVLTEKGKENVFLPGGEFELKDKDGKVIQSGLTTDKNGKVNLPDLKPGKYTLTQTKASKGYELNKDVIEFTVEKCEDKTVPVTNEPTPVDPKEPNNGVSPGGTGKEPTKPTPKPSEPSKPGKPGIKETNGVSKDQPKQKGKLPQTGEQNLLYLMVLGTALLGAGALVLIRKRRDA